MAFRFVKSVDSFIDFFSTYGAAGLDSIGCRKFVASGCLGCEKLTEEDMAVCESFFNDQSVRRVVI